MDSAWSPGASVLGEFDVEKELGGGGFGRVALVRSRRSGEQYAVKRVLVADERAQRRFLAEVQRWIGLPDHPHIAACRFARTIDDELLVFSEYVPGGSLADWIRSGRLYDGDHPLASIVRIAKETAWALSAAHATGLLHLDVKPANVLLTTDGCVKLTDFGLASAASRDPEEQMQTEAFIDSVASVPELDEDERAAVRAVLRRELDGARSDESIRALPEGFTTAYASPEQAEGLPVGRGADLWSWATTVLEMFAGERTWPSGALADAVLERLAAGPQDRWRLVPPAGLADLLQTCLQPDPSQRPSSIAAAADALAEVEVRELGLPNSASTHRPDIAEEPVEIHRRRLISGGSWSDPRYVLYHAYELAGLDPSAAAPYFPSGRGTCKAQSYEDLRALSEARRVLDSVPGPETPDLRWSRAMVRAEAGRVQLSVGDASGGIAELRAAAELLVGVDDENSPRLLAPVLNALASALRDNGHLTEALAVHDDALEVAEGLPQDREGLRTLGTALLSKANTISSQAWAETLPLYDRAVDCYERSGDAEGVAKTWAAKATALKAMDRAADAERLFKLADEQLQTLGTPVRDDLAATRARLSTNRAILAAPAAEQLQHAQAAADIFILLVRERGWHELAGDLGRAQFVTGQAYEDLGRPRPALDAYREARTTLADAVVRDGRSEWAGQLADAYNHESTLANVLEGPAAALVVSTRALKLWQQLADLDGLDSWAVELAKVRQQLGTALMNTGDLEGARRQFDEALRAVPDHMLERPGARLTTAHTLRSYGVLARTTGDPETARDYYRQALAALGAPEDHQKLAARALILESFAGALGDLGDYDNAIRAQQASTADVETSAGQGRRAADLAGSYQRLSNMLLQSGDFDAAKHAATKVLAVFEQLIADGRDDLVEEAASQRSVYAFILHRLSDIEGAVIALTSACKTYASLAGADEQLAYMARMLGTQLDELREITALRPRKRARWLARQRSSLERAGRFSRAGNSRQASQQIEAIVGSLGWLNRRHPTIEGHVLAGQAGNYLGVTAMHANRNDAARHGFTTAIRSYRSLVAADRRYIDEWAKAYIGLASLLAITNDAGGSNEVLRQLESSIGEVDPSAARRWRKHADATIATLR